MSAFQPRDPEFESKVRSSFANQAVMNTLGAALERVEPGETEITLPFKEALTQHHGYLHAGVLTTIADSACGYAALTLMPAGANVLTVEYKVNFLAPASGEKMIARGRVVKPGRTITVCQGEVVAVQQEREKLIATMSATMIRR